MQNKNSVANIPVISITADCLPEAWETTHPAFEMMTAETREKLAQDTDWFARAKG